jgi:aerobic carbon-monoxide dehydrogenase large subunit
MAEAIGAPLRRREDAHHLAGQGRFTDDLAARRPGALHAVLVRSPHPHARIERLDPAAARAATGVVAVVTAADLGEDVRPLRPNWVLPGGMPVPEHRVLAESVVRFEGDPVAVVVAEDAHTARDAAELVEVDYTPLPAVIDPWQAARAGAPAVHDGANVLFRFPARGGNYARACRSADVVVTRRLRNQNLTPSALEPRSVLAEPDPSTGGLTVHTGTQAPHIIKRMLAEVLGIDEHRLRVVAPDVGGGFGAKLHLYPEEVLVTHLAHRLGRAVRWTATRTEDVATTNHGRDHVQDVELCATRDGVITGVKATIWANLGAYLSGMAAGIPAVNCGFMVPGVYRIRNLDVEVVGVLTHTARVDTYRGAGRPEATYLIERMVDHLAREIGMDPAQVRRRNLIPPSAFPYRLPTRGIGYDSGDYPANLDHALDVAGYADLRRRQVELREEGRYLGIGLCTYTEFTGIGPGRALNMLGFSYGGWEYARVIVHPTGAVTVHTGSADQGQGHATSYAQIAADALGLPAASIEVVEGDTGRVAFGLGTFNSRSMSVGGPAVHRAATAVLDKARRIAAHALGVTPAGLDYADGAFSIRADLGPGGQVARAVRRGRRRGIARVLQRAAGLELPDAGRGRHALRFDEVARLAHFASTYPSGLEPGLDERVFHQPPGMTFPFGTYLAAVEVDPATGDVTVEKLLAVDDCGTVINPLLARGQVHGGVAQGLGQALLEATRYREDGTLASADWTGYAMPRATDVPRIETGHTVTPSPRNPLGVKGIGESGAIATPPALVNAVLDALAPLGVTHLDMPLTPDRVHAAIVAARPAPAPRRVREPV